MDDLARAFFELMFENAFLKKRADEFQDFFASIMEKVHPGDFIRVRPWGRLGDRKNDGYLKSERILFQVYAPNEMRASTAIAKIDEDFREALPYWRAHFEKWVFVHNSRGLSPEVTAKLLDLGREHNLEVAPWGFEELRQRAFRLDYADLASLLGPVPSKRDMLDLGLEALTPVLDHLARMQPPDEPDLRPPPADKISRNMLSNQATTLLKAGMTRADLVRRYFRVQETRRDEIAESFRTRYESARRRGMSPDEIFWELQRHAGGDDLPSVAHQSGILAVLAFFFEECDIFERDVQLGAPS